TNWRSSPPRPPLSSSSSTPHTSSLSQHFNHIHPASLVLCISSAAFIWSAPEGRTNTAKLPQKKKKKSEGDQKTNIEQKKSQDFFSVQTSRNSGHLQRAFWPPFESRVYHTAPVPPAAVLLRHPLYQRGSGVLWLASRSLRRPTLNPSKLIIGMHTLSKKQREEEKKRSGGEKRAAARGRRERKL
ncbi:uncharacterized protein ARB_03928, partial [Trichophyton benhamiae CBS 112371]